MAEAPVFDVQASRLSNLRARHALVLAEALSAQKAQLRRQEPRPVAPPPTPTQALQQRDKTPTVVNNHKDDGSGNQNATSLSNEANRLLSELNLTFRTITITASPNNFGDLTFAVKKEENNDVSHAAEIWTTTRSQDQTALLRLEVWRYPLRAAWLIRTIVCVQLDRSEPFKALNQTLVYLTQRAHHYCASLNIVDDREVDAAHHSHRLLPTMLCLPPARRWERLSQKNWQAICLDGRLSLQRDEQDRAAGLIIHIHRKDTRL